MQTETLPDSSLTSDGRQNPYICVSSANACGLSWWRSISRRRSVLYSTKRIGPRTDPCGRPQPIVDGVELVADMRMCCTRSLKYDVNQLMASLPRPSRG